MIIEFFLDIVVNLFCGLISACQVVKIPVDIVATLSAITCYGSYVCGSDFILVMFGCIGSWLTIKCTLGLVLFIWRLLPFT